MLNFYSDVPGIVNVFQRVGNTVRGLSTRLTASSVKIERCAAWCVKEILHAIHGNGSWKVANAFGEGQYKMLQLADACGVLS